MGDCLSSVRPSGFSGAGENGRLKVQERIEWVRERKLEHPQRIIGWSKTSEASVVDATLGRDGYREVLQLVDGENL